MNNKPYHHGNLEEALIKAGIEILAKDGLDGCSLRKVAAACGVSHAAPYKHFADKEALLEAMQTYMATKFSEALNNSLELSKDSPHYMIYLAQAYLDFFMQNPSYLNLLLMQERHMVNLSELDKPSNYKPFEIFRKSAIKHLNECGVKDDLIPTIIIGMWAIVYGITMMSVMKGVCYEGDWKELLLQVFLSTDINKNYVKDREGLL